MTMHPGWHPIFEALAYFIGFQCYLWQRRQARLPQPASWQALAILAGAICGGALGSKLLYLAQYASAIGAQGWPLPLLLGGKTVVGGWIGGITGVELAKRLIGWRQATGDQIWLAMAMGLLIGRIGCQLAGLHDLTYGLPSNLPWAWVYEDGVARHPTPIYEQIWLLLLIALVYRWRSKLPLGGQFRLFICGYFLFRFAVEFLKPPFGPVASGLLQADLWLGLTAIQWAAMLGALYYGRLLARDFRLLQ